jgi:hypothetical protein
MQLPPYFADAEGQNPVRLHQHDALVREVRSLRDDVLRVEESLREAEEPRGRLEGKAEH